MSNSKALILVDDRALRRQAFQAAFKLLRQLSDLEARISSFESEDQQLFADWRHVMFRSREDRLRHAESEIDRLKQTLSRIEALERVENISRASAAARVLDEELRYRRGEIGLALLWSEREERLREWQREQERVALERERRRQEREQRRVAAEEARRREMLDAIAELSDEDLNSCCQSPRQTQEWLWHTLWEARQSGNAQLFLRVWSATHAKIRRAFARDFQYTFDVEFDDILEQMSALQDERETAPASREESVKLLYRQLVRLLHPDAQPDQELSAWRKDLWQRAQDAYRARDQEQLSRLMQLAQLRTQKLENLRLSEIVESREWLQVELARLRTSVRSLKRSPAWGFSRRKDFAPLIRKVEREIERRQQDLDSAREQLENLIRYGF